MHIKGEIYSHLFLWRSVRHLLQVIVRIVQSATTWNHVGKKWFQESDYKSNCKNFRDSLFKNGSSLPYPIGQLEKSSSKLDLVQLNCLLRARPFKSPIISKLLLATSSSGNCLPYLNIWGVWLVSTVGGRGDIFYSTWLTHYFMQKVTEIHFISES